MNLIRPTKMFSSVFRTDVEFPLYREILESSYGTFTLHDFVRIMGDKPFIIFCFVCRDMFQHEVRYHYIKDNNLYPKELTELKEIIRQLDPEIFNSEHKPQPLPLNPNAKVFMLKKEEDEPYVGGTMNLERCAF